MKPDRSNYETWLIDYLDGNLDKVSESQLMSFLEENPAIREEFGELQQYSIKPGSFPFINKSHLIKTASELSETQFGYQCVAEVENDLTADQGIELRSILDEDPRKGKILEEIRMIKLNPPVIRYKKKRGLKKYTPGQKIGRYSVIGISIAATIALLVTIFSTRSTEGRQPNSAPLATGVTDTGSKSVIKKNLIAVNRDARKASGNTTPVINLIPEGTKDHSSSAVKPLTEVNAESSVLPDDNPGIKISSIEFRDEVTLGKTAVRNDLVTIKTNDAPMGIAEVSRINAFIARTFRERIYKAGTGESGTLKAYEIADAGINGLNKLFGWQMTLIENRDNQGEVRSLHFNSRFLKIDAPVKKPQLGT